MPDHLPPEPHTLDKVRPRKRRRIANDNAREILDVADDLQVRAWAQRYDVDEDDIRWAGKQGGGNRTAVEILLGVARL